MTSINQYETDNAPFKKGQENIFPQNKISNRQIKILKCSVTLEMREMPIKQ